MRGVRTWISAASLASLLTAMPAWADPGDDYGPAATQCTITDPRIDELSGLVALPTGEMLVVEDSAPEPRPGSTSVLLYRLDAACGVNGEVAEFDQDPRDVEDLAFRDNRVWFADIGDNGLDRQNVALITVSYDPSSTQEEVDAPQVLRLAYPDGPHDAEALLLAPDGTPYVVTKDSLGQSAVYRPASPIDPAAEVEMEKVADLEFAMTGTPGGPIGRAGQLLVTGGAVAADGSRIALRTYTDAYIWPLSGSDVASALQADPLAVVALPDAPQGEAISFAPDSRSLMLGSEGGNSVITVVPAVLETEASDPAATTGTEAGPFAGNSADGDTTAGTMTAGLIAVIVVTALIWVVLRLRRRSG